MPSTLCLYKAGYDFKRLFTISEYDDRDRPTFYKSIQSVRYNDMDTTGWLDYSVTGLKTQMIEDRERSEQVIRRDVLVQQLGLNEVQGKALGYLLQPGKLTIQDFEALCPTFNCRSLQRDLKGMLDKNPPPRGRPISWYTDFWGDLGGNLRLTRDKTCDRLTTMLATDRPASLADQAIDQVDSTPYRNYLHGH